jgi:hypothetical protein
MRMLVVEAATNRDRVGRRSVHVVGYWRSRESKVLNRNWQFRRSNRERRLLSSLFRRHCLCGFCVIMSGIPSRLKDIYSASCADEECDEVGVDVYVNCC